MVNGMENANKTKLLKVRDYIALNKWKNIKFRIDNVIFDSETIIPEDILNLEVKSYIYHMIDVMVLWMRTEKTHRDEDCIKLT